MPFPCRQFLPGIIFKYLLPSNSSNWTRQHTSALYITCHRLHKRDLGSSSCGMPRTDIGKCANLKQNRSLRKPMVRCWLACIWHQSGMPLGHRGCMVSMRLSRPRSASGTQQEQIQLQGALRFPVCFSAGHHVKSNIQVCKYALLMWSCILELSHRKTTTLL